MGAEVLEEMEMEPFVEEVEASHREKPSHFSVPMAGEMASG